MIVDQILLVCLDWWLDNLKQWLSAPEYSLKKTVFSSHTVKEWGNILTKRRLVIDTRGNKFFLYLWPVFFWWVVLLTSSHSPFSSQDICFWPRSLPDFYITKDDQSQIWNLKIFFWSAVKVWLSSVVVGRIGYTSELQVSQLALCLVQPQPCSLCNLSTQFSPLTHTHTLSLSLSLSLTHTHTHTHTHTQRVGLSSCGWVQPVLLSSCHQWN